MCSVVIGELGKLGRDGLAATLGVSGSGKSHMILSEKCQRGLTQDTRESLLDECVFLWLALVAESCHSLLSRMEVPSCKNKSSTASVTVTKSSHLPSFIWEFCDYKLIEVASDHASFLTFPFLTLEQCLHSSAPSRAPNMSPDHSMFRHATV